MRALRIAIVVAAALGFLLSTMLFFPRWSTAIGWRDPVTPYNARRIIPGMNREQIAAVLGREPHDDCGDMLVFANRRHPARIWIGLDGASVREAEFVRVPPETPLPWWEKFLRWLES